MVTGAKQFGVMEINGGSDFNNAVLVLNNTVQTHSSELLHMLSQWLSVNPTWLFLEAK